MLVVALAFGFRHALAIDTHTPAAELFDGLTQGQDAWNTVFITVIGGGENLLGLIDGDAGQKQGAEDAG